MCVSGGRGGDFSRRGGDAVLSFSFVCVLACLISLWFVRLFLVNLFYSVVRSVFSVAALLRSLQLVCGLRTRFLSSCLSFSPSWFIFLAQWLVCNTVK